MEIECRTTFNSSVPDVFDVYTTNATLTDGPTEIPIITTDAPTDAPTEAPYGTTTNQIGLVQNKYHKKYHKFSGIIWFTSFKNISI